MVDSPDWHDAVATIDAIGFPANGSPVGTVFLALFRRAVSNPSGALVMDEHLGWPRP